MIQHGADVNAQPAQDQGHNTPLHLASSGWDAETVQLLILKGADVNERDESHKTPLHLILSRVSADTVRLLIKHGTHAVHRLSTTGTCHYIRG